jgi:lipoyl(octanoyl) transferase
MPDLWHCALGQVPYGEALVLQHELHAARRDDRIPDVLLTLEHPPTYTRGRRSDDSELPMGEEWYRAQGIEVWETDRGGRVTYHGPGQLVGYPIVSLRPLRDDVHRYVRTLEAALVAALAHYGVEATTREGLTGVWTPEPRKIGSIGIHVSRGVTTHGFAVNISNDLQPFEWIVPCGIEHCGVSSLTREKGVMQAVGPFAKVVSEELARALGRRLVEVSPESLMPMAEVS